MKKAVALFGILAILFAVCLTGCSAQNNIVITDCKSGQVVAEFSSKEHQDDAASITNALNTNGEYVEQIDYSQKYLLHFIDPKDSLYDVWCYIYVNNDSPDLYIQYDIEKMKDYNDKSDGFFDDKLRKSTGMTAAELSDIIAKYKPGS